MMLRIMMMTAISKIGLEISRVSDLTATNVTIVRREEMTQTMNIAD